MDLKAGRFLTSILLGAALIFSAPGVTQAAAGQAVTVTSHQVSESEVVTVKADQVEAKALPGNIQQGPAISEQEAVKIIRSAFPHLPAGGEPEIMLEEDYATGKLIWRINVYEQTRYRPGPYNGYYANVDAVTGEIRNMSWRQYAPVESAEVKGIITREQARQVADQLARQLQPDKFKQLTYNDQAMEQYYPRESINIAYTFVWERTNNGVTVGHDGIRIAVDALTGMVQSYDFQWQPDLKLPAPAPAVDAEKLAGRVVDEAGLVLVYKVFLNSSYTTGAPEVKLVYQLNSSYANMVDAVTGNYLNYDGKAVKPAEAKLYTDYTHLKGNVNPPSGTERISPAKAQAEAERFLALIGLEGQVERSGSGSGSGPLGRQEYWHYSIREEGAAGGTQISLGVDVVSGRVLEFSRHGYGYSQGTEPPTVSSSEARSRAMDFIKKLNPEYAGNVALVNMPEWGEDSGYQFNFIRVANGIPFPMNNIQIRLSGDGEVLNYRCEWHHLNFPGVDGVISPEEAADKWLEKAAYKLSYFMPLSYESRVTPAAGEAKLIYRLDTAIEAVDALTGVVLDYQGRPVNGQTNNGYDFTASWSAQSLQLLAQSGLLPPPDEFALAAPVTRRDAARVVAAAATPYYRFDVLTKSSSYQDVKAGDPDFGAIESLAELKIIDRGGSFKPDQQLTRLELAIWLVNAVGHKDVTAIPNKITAPFQDISALSGQEQNYLGLAYGFGFMSGGSSDMFRPGDVVTWEELSAVITRALPQIRKNAAW